MAGDLVDVRVASSAEAVFLDRPRQFRRERRSSPPTTRSMIAVKTPRKRENPPGCPLRGTHCESPCFIGQFSIVVKLARSPTGRGRA